MGVFGWRQVFCLPFDHLGAMYCFSVVDYTIIVTNTDIDPSDLGLISQRYSNSAASTLEFSKVKIIFFIPSLTEPAPIVKQWRAAVLCRFLCICTYLYLFALLIHVSNVAF